MVFLIGKPLSFAEEYLKREEIPYLVAETFPVCNHKNPEGRLRVIRVKTQEDEVVQLMVCKVPDETNE